MKACCEVYSDYGVTMSVAIYLRNVPSVLTIDSLVNANLLHFLLI